MAQIKLLSDDDIDLLKRKYIIEIKDDFLTIRTTHHNRVLFHELNDKIRVRYNDKTMIITPFAIKCWKNKFSSYSLIEVQNAINTLTVLNQKVSDEAIDNLFKRKHTKIITI